MMYSMGNFLLVQFSLNKFL